MRTLFPERRTLPSRMEATLSLCAMVPMSVSLPLNENEEVRAITFSASICDRATINSSVMPSEKYSCFGSPLRFVNGNTATELLGGANTALVVSLGPAVDGEETTVAAAECCPRECTRNHDTLLPRTSRAIAIHPYRHPAWRLVISPPSGVSSAGCGGSSLAAACTCETSASDRGSAGS